MMKIPFDIKFRPQIESGEYKVETRDGRPVRVICWDRKYGFPICGLATEADGHESYVNCYFDGSADSTKEDSSDLFIVTPEGELTEFEKSFLERVFHQKAEELDEENREIFMEDARYVLGLAREQFIKDGYVIEKKAFHDAVENISDNHLAEMSVEYSIHCKVEDGTRNAVMNWEAFQKVAQKFIDIGKAEALTDLPRWIDDGLPTGSAAIDISGLCGFDFIRIGGRLLRISDLEKLPGFNE